MKKLIMIIMAVALIALPTMAQEQQWQSTSTMQGTGSVYTPQVNAVGATSVGQMATTTSAPTKAPGGPRRVIEDNTDPGQLDEGSPIGDAVLPLMLLACAYLGLRVFLKRKRALSR